MSTPRFIYFDLGKVLVDFSIERMCRQIGQVVGLDAQQVHEAIYGNGLQRQYERGLISDRQYYEHFCRLTGTRPDPRQLWLAGSDIFELNRSVLPIITQLVQNRWPLGMLSNTCRQHWEFITRRFPVLLSLFPIRVLSFEVHAAKPEVEIFRAAAEKAKVPPGEIFFVDDVADNVRGAQQAGFDAMQYTTAWELAAALTDRGVRLSY